MASDEGLLGRIEELMHEEDELYARAQQEGGMSPSERDRLHALQVSLDQCWDLMRQRQARREFGEDPEAARVRDPEVVESYEQ